MSFEVQFIRPTELQPDPMPLFNGFLTEKFKSLGKEQCLMRFGTLALEWAASNEYELNIDQSGRYVFTHFQIRY